MGIAERVVVPLLQFRPAEPLNLLEMLEAQARCLIASQIPEQVGVDEAKFFDDAMRLAGEFVFSIELANIGLNRVALVHYGVRGRHLAEVGGVKLWSDPDKFTLFEGVTTPGGLAVVQGQFGPKYKNRRPTDVRQNHDALEQLGVPEEGLTAYLYWGDDLLRESYMDFPGAVSEYGRVPCLALYDERPALDASGSAYADPYWGCVSISRG